MSAPFTNLDIQEELTQRVHGIIVDLLADKYPDVAFPAVTRSRELAQGDMTMMMASVCGKLKRKPNEFVAEVVAALSGKLPADGLIKEVVAAGPYLNINLNRPLVFRLTMQAALAGGDRFGHTKSQAGKKVIVEHTSSNPNAPLHIGNLRSTLLGAHLSKMLSAVGYDVKQLFLVNDLGAQIGLTALGFHKIYDKIEPKLKIDHWIGFIYAITNTFSELQKLGYVLGPFSKAINAGETPAAPEGADAEKCEEYIGIYKDLESRQPELFKALLTVCLDSPNIKEEAAKLNLDYENQVPEAISIFRKMTTDCLAGVQETLDTYGVRHDRFDFESQLGWEGSNQSVLKALRSSPYYVPPTQCNDEGKPQGGYLNCDKFLKDFGYQQGKRGYQKNYPPLYVVRPDGSTLYSFRDAVYSLKKTREADLVLNVICSEQNLAQEKVRLALKLLDPEYGDRLQHVSYELVKLSTGRMSGRRGRYVTADDLYDDLRTAVAEILASREGAEHTVKEEADSITHQVATAAMKYALLSSSVRTQISFDVAKITDFSDSSAPFLLYNASRLSTLRANFDKKVAEGALEALPSFDDIDFSLLDAPQEWELLMTFVIPFASIIHSVACPQQPPAPQLIEWHAAKMCEFLVSFVRMFSSYYKHVRIIDPNSQKAMHARLYLSKVFHIVISNGMRLLMIEPLERM